MYHPHPLWAWRVVVFRDMQQAHRKQGVSAQTTSLALLGSGICPRGEVGTAAVKRQPWCWGEVLALPKSWSQQSQSTQRRSSCVSAVPFHGSFTFLLCGMNCLLVLFAPMFIVAAAEPCVLDSLQACWRHLQQATSRQSTRYCHRVRMCAAKGLRVLQCGMSTRGSESRLSLLAPSMATSYLSTLLYQCCHSAPVFSLSAAMIAVG